ncbi:MAG: DUF116 domain-containing protein [Methanomassiliicoccales archaeon]|nr:DUF116 domain-containing protein [Methanomassiliicoccales archaeon]
MSEATILFLVLFLLFIVCIAGVVLLSIKHDKFYFPRLMRAGFKFMDGVVRSVCKFAGVEDNKLTVFFIRLHNSMSESDFANTDFKDRAIFLPHCLRSSQCPANLTPEGLFCKHCGKCELDHTIDELEGMGYKVFIVPGSTFINRMVKKYLPRAIIGVGCIREVKDGLEFADKIGVIVMGVINKTDGCVETLADLQELMSIAMLRSPHT